MGEYTTVTEVRATAELRVEVPLAMGSNVGKGVEDLLRPVDELRYVTDIDTGTVTKRSDTLLVDATATLTVHLPDQVNDDITTTICTILENHDPVATVETVAESESYQIESY